MTTFDVPELPELPELPQMFDELRAAPEVVQPSAFWEHLTELNLAQLSDHGFGEFKRTVNRHYFQWLEARPWHAQNRLMTRRWLEHPSAAALAARMIGEFPAQHLPAWRRRLVGKSYAFFVGSLMEYVRRHDRLGICDRLEEPPLGHPAAVRHRGRVISEDLCNTVLELNSSIGELPGGRPPSGGVIELGAGYGRYAWALLEAFPGTRFIVVDIPPALAIAERYLTSLFPDRPAFRFRRFASHDEVAAEMAAAEIVFLMPHQLDLLPGLEAGLFVNISSLHEMRRDQIRHYFDVIDRHCNGWFYTKQWEVSENPHDGLEIRRADYPVPGSWHEVYSRRHQVQQGFFEALYRLRG